MFCLIGCQFVYPPNTLMHANKILSYSFKIQIIIIRLVDSYLKCIIVVLIVDAHRISLLRYKHTNQATITTSCYRVLFLYYTDTQNHSSKFLKEKSKLILKLQCDRLLYHLTRCFKKLLPDFYDSR